jgi:hypothetical protein
LKFLRLIINLFRFDRTNWTALALSVIAASVFWVFTALNKTYSTNLTLGLQVTYDESRYAPAQPVPNKIAVNVQGIGWELLRKSLGQKVPVVTIALERPADVKRIAGSALEPQVVSQLGAMTLNYVVLDTLRLAIEPKTARTIKLVADISKVTFRNAIGRISPVVILPDSIHLEGPQSYVGALPDSLEVSVTDRRVGEHYRESLEVRFPNSEFIKRDPPVAEIMFEVGPIVEVSHRIVITRPKSWGMARVNPDSVEVRFSIPKRDEERFKTDVMSVAAEFPLLTLRKGDTIRVRPGLLQLPDYALVTEMDSVEIIKQP